MTVTGRISRLTAIRGAILMAGLAWWAPSAEAQTTKTLVVAKDATIRGGSYATTRHGTQSYLATRKSDNATYERRAVLTFDTDTTVPARATIRSARLILTVRGGNDETRRLNAYSVPISFEQEDVTWRQRKRSTNWRYAGGDTVGSAVRATVSATRGSQVSFDVTAQVQRVVNGDYGSRYARFLVADGGSSSRGSYREYYSREASTSSTRPRLVVTYGGSGTSTPSPGSGSPAPVPQLPDQEPAPAPEPAPEPSRSSTLKVLHWNLHHGVGSDGRYDLQRFVNYIAQWRPDVISLNEVEKNTGWGNEDQPNRLRSMIASATGQRWYVHFAQRYGNWSSNGQGNVILSRYPFVSTGREAISYDRSVAIATIVVNGRNVTVMSTHLDADSNARRETQVRQIQNIASGWSNPRIVAGDFNAWPDHNSYDIMTGQFYDSWAVAAHNGDASSFSGNSPFGATRNGRIDYIFNSRSSSVLSVRSSRVPDTRDSRGRMPSDHRPVLTTYNVR